MDYLKYLLIPLLLSAFLTPFLKVVATRLEIYALENERTVHSGKIARIGELPSMYLLLCVWRCL